jgi:mercuric ion transport protein
MKTAESKKLGIGLAGALLSAVATSSFFLALSCCAGPVVFLAIGLGFGSISTFESFASYTWLTLSLTILFLLIASLQVYKQDRMANCDSECQSLSTKRNRILLVLVVIMVLALLIFPSAFEKYLLQPK